MKKIMAGFAFCLLFVLHLAPSYAASASAAVAATASPVGCPVDPPCSCDHDAKVIHCEEPSLTIDHITFDELPPFSASTVEWKLLNLSYNFIHAIHGEPLVNLTKIVTIDLSHNRIGDVDAAAFEGVAGDIHTLDLSFNELVDFPTLALVEMRSLHELDLSENAIETIGEDAVAIIKGVLDAHPSEKINLKGNRFNCDCRLKKFLKLFKNQLNFHRFENPHDMKCAKPANLAGRVLGSLVDEELLCFTTLVPPTENPDLVFPPLCPAKKPCWCDYIGNIFCSKGEMLVGHNTTFHEIPRIMDLSEYVWEFLHLSGHQIQKVKSFAFYPLRIKRLSLTNNIIDTIEQGAFFGTELYLEMLLLEGNRLSVIPEPVLELPKLNVLDLSLNDIYHVYRNQTDGLYDLMYSHIHGDIQKNLFFIKFGRNAFNCTCEMQYFAKFVKDNRENFLDLNLMFCVHGLTSSGHQFVLKLIEDTTDDDFPGCVNPTLPPEPPIIPPKETTCPVKHPCWCTYSDDVICSGNLLLPPDCPKGNASDCPTEIVLTEIPKWSPVTNKIRHSGLYFDSNRIGTIDSGAFRGVRTIKLDLSNNTIYYIASDAFDGLEGDLEELILTNNRLVEVPDALFPMHLMETLDLGFNHIQSYHADNVKKMQDWRIKWIHNGTHLSPTEQRKGVQLRLGSNHLYCDKEMCALRLWVEEEPWDFIDEEEIWCALPQPWFGRLLHNVSLYELGCDPTPDIKTQLENALTAKQDALTAKHTLAGLFAFVFLICLALGAYVFYLRRYKLKASPIPVQFKNPLASNKQNGKDRKVLVDGVDSPVVNQTFDNFAESL